MATTATSIAHSSRYHGPIGCTRPQECEEDGDELGGGLDLAPHRRFHQPAGDRHHPPQPHHRDLPEDDDQRRPHPHPVDGDEAEEGPGDQQLVGGGVEERPQHRLLLPAPGQVPVEEVGEGGDPEQDGGDHQVLLGPPAGDGEGDHDRDDQQPRQRQSVGDRHLSPGIGGPMITFRRSPIGGPERMFQAWVAIDDTGTPCPWARRAHRGAAMTAAT